MTQPSVSAGVAALEREIGVKLFERDGRGVRPTDADAAFAPSAANVLGLLEQGWARCARGRRRGAHDAAHQRSNGRRGPPRPAAHPHVPRCAPELDLELRIGNRREVFGWLLDHHADVATTGRVPDDARLTGEAFGVNEIVLVTAPDDPLATRRWVAVEELAGRPWLLREPGSDARAMADEWLRVRGLAPPVLTLRSNTAVREAARAGLGIGLLSRTAAALELKVGMLGTIRPRGGLPQRQWFVARSTVGPARPAAVAFVAFLGSPAGRHVINRVLEVG